MKALEEFVVWDVEVIRGPDEVPGGWRNPEAMGLASAVVWDYGTQRYHFYLHESSKPKLIEHLKGHICIGFNSIRFDSRVLLGNDIHITPMNRVFVTSTGPLDEDNPPEVMLDHIDLLVAYIQQRYKQTTNWQELEEILNKPEIHDGTFNLDALCKATINMKKSGHGAHAPKLYKEKRYDELLEYNLQDVRLTKKLFEFISKWGYLIDGKGRSVMLPPSIQIYHFNGF